MVWYGKLSICSTDYTMQLANRYIKNLFSFETVPTCVMRSSRDLILVWNSMFSTISESVKCLHTTNTNIPATFAKVVFSFSRSSISRSSSRTCSSCWIVLFHLHCSLWFKTLMSHRIAHININREETIYNSLQTKHWHWPFRRFEAEAVRFHGASSRLALFHCVEISKKDFMTIIGIFIS